MSVYVTVQSPTAGEQIGTTAAYDVVWSASTDSQLGVLIDLQIIVFHTNKSGAQVINSSFNPGGTSYTRTYTIAANTLTPGVTYVMQLSGRDNTGQLTYVDRTISAVGATATPTITAPANGGTVTNPTATVTWTLAPSDQTHYQVQVLNGAAVVYDTGEVASSAQSLANVPFPDTGVSRTVRVRAKRGASYAWSAWATSTVTVTHTPPPTPTITALVATDVAGIGLAHALVATITQPAPGGGVPAVATTEFYVRQSGDSSTGQLVATVAGAATGYTYKSPTSGVLYQMRVRVVSSDGRYAYSGWFTANAALALKGVVLFSTAAPTVVKLFRYNGDEASDDYQPEAELIQYDGREFPVVEFGTSSTRTLKVNIDVKTDADRDALRTMLLSRSAILYRDRRGRKLYAFVQADAFVDTAYGTSTSLTITKLDYPSDRSV